MFDSFNVAFVLFYSCSAWLCLVNSLKETMSEGMISASFVRTVLFLHTGKADQYGEQASLFLIWCEDK